MRRKEFHAHDKLANDEKEKAGKDDEKRKVEKLFVQISKCAVWIIHAYSQH